MGGTGSELKWTSRVARWQQRTRPTWCRGEHATTGPDQTPGPFLVSRHPLSEGRPLLAVSGSSWGPVEVSSQVPWIVGGRLPLRGAQATGACSRLSPTVPGPRGGRGHTCRTPPRACSVSNATSQSVECLAGTWSAYQVQQRLLYVRYWTVLLH